MPLLEQHRKNERAGTSDGVYDRLIPRDFLTLRSNESKHLSRANSRTGITFLSQIVWNNSLKPNTVTSMTRQSCSR